MNSCLCGCGAQVANRFKQGHDAKLKSQLIHSALQGDEPEAEQRLEELGWTKFLDKARKNRARKALPAHQQRKIRAEVAEEEAKERIQLLANMTRAANALRECGRSPEIQVNKANWQAILDDPLEYEYGDEQ